jgi:hypothetical protein
MVGRSCPALLRLTDTHDQAERGDRQQAGFQSHAEPFFFHWSSPSLQEQQGHTALHQEATVITRRTRLRVSTTREQLAYRIIGTAVDRGCLLSELAEITRLPVTPRRITSRQWRQIRQNKAGRLNKRVGNARQYDAHLRISHGREQPGGSTPALVKPDESGREARCLVGGRCFHPAWRVLESSWPEPVSGTDDLVGARVTRSACGTSRRRLAQTIS